MIKIHYLWLLVLQTFVASCNNLKKKDNRGAETIISEQRVREDFLEDFYRNDYYIVTKGIGKSNISVRVMIKKGCHVDSICSMAFVKNITKVDNRNFINSNQKIHDEWNYFLCRFGPYIDQYYYIKSLQQVFFRLVTFEDVRMSVNMSDEKRDSVIRNSVIYKSISRFLSEYDMKVTGISYDDWLELGPTHGDITFTIDCQH